MMKLLNFVIMTISVNAQYRKNSKKYQEVMTEQKDILTGEISLHPDVKYIIDPSLQLLYADEYFFEPPETEDYRIGILMDPVSELV